jgi:hypothetical protein
MNALFTTIPPISSGWGAPEYINPKESGGYGAIAPVDPNRL